eukprot:1142191-Pelagomonas_calceolata.AAC.1
MPKCMFKPKSAPYFGFKVCFGSTLIHRSENNWGVEFGPKALRARAHLLGITGARLETKQRCVWPHEYEDLLNIYPGYALQSLGAHVDVRMGGARSKLGAVFTKDLGQGSLLQTQL